MSTEPFADYFASYAFGIAFIRENRVRHGLLPPMANSERETRWAKEGPIPFDQFDTVKEHQ